MTPAQPKARDERVRELSRMSKQKLAGMCQAGIRRPDGGLTAIEGAHPVITWTKDEIISSILSVEYPRIVPVALADAVPDAAAVPDGTTASRCTACGETRLSYPGDDTDEWKHHFDYCGDDDSAEGQPG